MRPGLTHHRKFRRLARAIGSNALAVGHLELLWQTAYQTGPLIGNADDVEAAAQWQGEPGVLVAALLAAGGTTGAGFIEPVGDVPEHYQIHDLYEHAPRYVERRARTADDRRTLGVSLSAIRAEAGRKGAASRWRRAPDATGEPESELRDTDGKPHGKPNGKPMANHGKPNLPSEIVNSDPLDCQQKRANMANGWQFAVPPNPTQPNPTPVHTADAVCTARAAEPVPEGVDPADIVGSRRAPLVTSHRGHACCGRVCLPAFLFDEFVRAHGGAEDAADRDVRAWFARVDAELAAIAAPIPSASAKYLRSLWDRDHVAPVDALANDPAVQAYRARVKARRVESSS